MCYQLFALSRLHGLLCHPHPPAPGARHARGHVPATAASAGGCSCCSGPPASVWTEEEDQAAASLPAATRHAWGSSDGSNPCCSCSCSRQCQRRRWAPSACLCHSPSCDRSDRRAYIPADAAPAVHAAHRRCNGGMHHAGVIRCGSSCGVRMDHASYGATGDGACHEWENAKGVVQASALGASPGDSIISNVSAGMLTSAWCHAAAALIAPYCAPPSATLPTPAAASTGGHSFASHRR